SKNTPRNPNNRRTTISSYNTVKPLSAGYTIHPLSIPELPERGKSKEAILERFSLDVRVFQQSARRMAERLEEDDALAAERAIRLLSIRSTSRSVGACWCLQVCPST